MTEAEWLAPRYTRSLLRYIEPKVSDRKLHYFSIACARRIVPLLPHPDSRRGIDALERFVEQQCGEEDIWQLRGCIEGAALSVEQGLAPGQVAAEQLPAARLAELVADPESIVGTARFTLILAAYFVFGAFRPVPQERSLRTQRYAPPHGPFQPRWLVHDIFGNPFRPVTFSPSWRTSTVLAIASQMYESRDFSAMPILADALQDAGCDSADVLDHCRGPGPHVRGCWVADLVLGKE